jgi:hypothetical protein
MSQLLQTITSLLNSLITNSLITKKTTTYNVAIPDPGVGQAQACGGVNPDSGIHTLPSYFVFFVLLLYDYHPYISFSNFDCKKVGHTSQSNFA